VALKFFRQGVKSCNIFTQRGLLPSNSWNPFAHPWSNHNSILDGKMGAKEDLIKHAFVKVSQWFTFTGVSNCATHDTNGVPAPRVDFPFQIVLVPTAILQHRFNDKKAEGTLQQMLAQIPPQKLWTLMAIAKPHGAWEEIGSVSSTTEWISSGYGDKSLYFQHQRFDDDLKYHPEWATVCPSVEACLICPADRDCAKEEIIYNPFAGINSPTNIPGTAPTNQPMPGPLRPS